MTFNCHWSARSTVDSIRKAARIAGRVGREVGTFILHHRETVIGGAGGYVIGRLVESIPFVGPLLTPLASTVLGVGGGSAGYRRELERRHLEAYERARR
jgi:hypothetical protein